MSEIKTDMVGILKKISGVVVWYNPTDENIMNIFSYIEYIDKLYIYDNSQDTNYEKTLIFEKYQDKIEYIYFGKNDGIAKALNYSADLSRESGYSWLLTMDQDSRFKDGTFENFYKYLEEEMLAIIGPNYVHQIGKEESLTENVYVKKIITSGNLVNLGIHKEFNGFDEKLFIDEVDHEYCYRVNKKYKIKQVADVYLEHSLGEVESNKILSYEKTYVGHSSFRIYYIVRNSLYVMKKYPEVRLEYSKMLIKSVLRIILVESDKKKKISSVLRAIKDARTM